MSSLSLPDGASQPRPLTAAQLWPFFLALLLGIHLYPLWSVTFFPSTDGAVHLAITDALRAHLFGETGVITRYTQLNPAIEPNYAIYGLLLALTGIVPPAVAEKLVVSLYAVLLCGGAAYVLHALNPRNMWLTGFIAFSAFGYFIHMGFYNYCLSVAAFLLVLGYWLRVREDLWGRHGVILSALGFLLIATHLVGFAVLLLTLGAVTTSDYAARLWRERRLRVVGAYLLRAALLVLIFLPSMLVMLSFFQRHGLDAPSGAEVTFSTLRKVSYLASFAHLYSFSRFELALTAPLLLLLAALLGLALRQALRRLRLHPADGLLLAFLGLLLVYFFLPVTTKGVPVSERLLPFMFALLVLWLARLELAPRLVGFAVLALLAFNVAQAGYRIERYQRIDAITTAYVSITPKVKADATLTALHLWQQTTAFNGQQLTWRTDVFRHVPDRISSARDGLFLRNALMSTAVYGYFPVIYRPDYDAFAHTDYTSRGPHAFTAFLDYPACSAGRLDQVVVWQIDETALPEATATRLATEFRQSALVESAALGRLRLFTRDAAHDAAVIGAPPRCAATGAVAVSPEQRPQG